MALPRALFSGDSATAVLMPAPINAVFQLKPLRPRLAAAHQKRQGLTLEGFAQAEGRQTIQASFDPLRQLEANLWLARELVMGWDGLTDDSGEMVPFSPSNLDAVASDPACWQLIYQEAEKLAGRRIEEEKGN